MDSSGAGGRSALTGWSAAAPEAAGWRSRRHLVDRIDLLIIIEFTLVTFAFYPRSLQFTGVDAATYWSAAHRWLTGGDAYGDLSNLVFAAPPPTLAVLAPFAFLP